MEKLFTWHRRAAEPAMTSLCGTQKISKPAQYKACDCRRKAIKFTFSPLIAHLVAIYFPHTSRWCFKSTWYLPSKKQHWLKSRTMAELMRIDYTLVGTWNLKVSSQDNINLIFVDSFCLFQFNKFFFLLQTAPPNKVK